MAIPEYVDLPTFKDALDGSAGVGARTAASLSDERLQAALDDAHAEVVGKIRTRYTEPAPGAEPAQIREWVVAIAGYSATLEWLQGSDIGDRDPVVLRYQRAEKLLGDIVAGRYALDLEDAPAGATGEAEGYDIMPAVALTEDVSAPSYGGLIPSTWHGGGLRW